MSAIITSNNCVDVILKAGLVILLSQQVSVLTDFNSDICDICGKIIAGDKARTNVTQFLSSESRCACILPERAVRSSSLLNRPERLFAEKEKAQEIKFVGAPLGDSAYVSPTQAAQNKADLTKIQANLPARYEVTELLGQGGMGAVFKGFDHEEKRSIAIKVIRPQLVNDATAIKRFNHEAKVASSLTHANVASVYAYGIGKEGAPFLIMELVEGLSLESILKREGKLKSKRAVDICLQVTRALEAAHAKEILHRDVKPSNIIVGTANGVEIAKLADFGIAKSLLPAADVSQSITQTGLMVGSPMYMSPEQCEGNKIDHRSDIYSLGCVLYKCLCGETPFQSENALKVLMQHIEEEPAPVCTKVHEHLSDDLNYIVMSCLDKDRYNRYSSATQLAHDLECRLTGRKIHAHNNQDYSPVHVLKPNPHIAGQIHGPSYALNIAVAYDKKGWKVSQQLGLRQASTKVPRLIGVFLISLFFSTSLAVTFYNSSQQHKDAVLAGNNAQRNVDAGDYSADEIVQNKKLLPQAVLILNANAHDSMRKKMFKLAIYRFELLSKIFEKVNQAQLEADSLYYLAHCEAKAGMPQKKTIADYQRALDVYASKDLAGPLTLQGRAERELQLLKSGQDVESESASTKAKTAIKDKKSKGVHL